MNTEDFIKKKDDEFKSHPIIKVKDIGRQGNHCLYREAWTFLPQSNLKEKVFVVERLRKDAFEGNLSYKGWRKGDIEYRIGYYIVGKIGKAKGKWIWGQFCPMIPKEDFDKLINKARKEGTII